MNDIVTGSAKKDLNDISRYSGTNYKEQVSEEESTIGEYEFETGLNSFEKHRSQSDILNIVNILRDYVKLGYKRKNNYFRIRRIDPIAYNYKIHPKPGKKGQRSSKRNYKIKSAELEMATIKSLREMYFNKPETLRAVEEIKAGKEPKDEKLQEVTEIRPPISVCRHYLNKYKQIQLDDLFVKIPRKERVEPIKPQYAKIKKSRDTIRNGYVVSVFNVDDDKLFTDRELFKIHRMKHHYTGSFKKIKDKEKMIPSKEMWEWDEVVNSNFPKAREASSIYGSRYMIHESEGKPIPKPKPEKRMVHYLANWFKRESPTEKREGEFQFFEKRRSRKNLYWTEKNRLNAAIKFLKYAKIVYPDLECLKVLKELENYIGPISLDGEAQSTPIGTQLKRPNKKLRYFRKLLKDTKELGNMFAVPDAEDDLDVKGIISVNEQTDTLKHNFVSNNMLFIYDKYIESYLPFPFNEIFISIANSLLKYSTRFSSDPEVKQYKKEIAHFVSRILHLVLESMKEVTDRILRTGYVTDLSKIVDSKIDKETGMDKGQKDGPTETFKEGSDRVIKRLLANLMKQMNLINMIHQHDPDISSTECQSHSHTNSEEERNR